MQLDVPDLGGALPGAPPVGRRASSRTLTGMEYAFERSQVVPVTPVEAYRAAGAKELLR
jgi:hypothetical protein